LPPTKLKAGAGKSEPSAKGDGIALSEPTESEGAQKLLDAAVRATGDQEGVKTAMQAVAETVVQAATAEDPAARAEKSSAKVQDGMSDASGEGTMQSASDVNEDSGLTGQKLPAYAVVGGVSKVSVRARKFEGGGTEDAGVDASNRGGASVAAGVSGNGRWEDPQAGGVEGASKTGAIEAVHRALDNATLGLDRTGAGSLMVMVRPDAQTELALHVSWKQDHYEATAVVERGDFAALGAEWTHLRQRLADQGVSLGPLVSASEYASTGGRESFSGRREPSEEREQLEASRPAEMARPVIAQRPSDSRPASAVPGREWWA
jgi:hypothetical protein